MKKYVLNYYPQFKCIAQECKHTCCAGWEMNIDEKSLYSYKNDNSAFNTVLKNGIDFKKSKFKTDKYKRCAFLNENSLCDIIINLGEQNLCQVCRDHPRFRSFFNDRQEMGLGFCCEQASRIILSYKDKIQPILISDDKQAEELDFSQKNILEFREKVLSITQDRSLAINKRIEKLLCLCGASFINKDFNKLIKKFLSFERLEKSWTKRLKSIDRKTFDINTDESLAIYCEQFLVNAFYRHLSCAEDTMWVRAITLSCVFSWWVINSILQTEQKGKEQDFELIVDVVRAFSAEVEYSQNNLDKLYIFAYNFIKIR